MENATTKRVREANLYFNLSKTQELENFLNDKTP